MGAAGGISLCSARARGQIHNQLQLSSDLTPTYCSPNRQADESEKACEWAVQHLRRPGDTFHLLRIIPLLPYRCARCLRLQCQLRCGPCLSSSACCTLFR